jgi:hypothetical protein
VDHGDPAPVEPRIATTCVRPSLSQRHLRTKGGGSWAKPLGKTTHRRIGFGSPPALFRRWEPFPNAMHRVWGPFPAEGVSCAASPSRFRPPPLVPGLFWFRARVILLADDPTPRWEMPARPRTKLPTEAALPLHPTRPKPRPPMPEQTLPFPPPEPPLLWALSAFRGYNGDGWRISVRRGGGRPRG